MAKISGFAKAFAGRAAHCRNGHQATLANTAEFFNSLLDRLIGNALFVGPTFYAKLSEKVWMSAAWSAQVAGHAHNEIGALDLTNFERHRAVLRFGYNF